jgi:hypothetical protein
MKYPQIEWDCLALEAGYEVRVMMPRTKDTQMIMIKAFMPKVELENLKDPTAPMWAMINDMKQALIRRDV